MGNRYHIGIALGAFVLAMMLMSSPATAVPESDYLFNTNQVLQTQPNLEFAKLTAGIGRSVYAEVFIFGGHDGSNFPVDETASGLSEATVWFVTHTNQADYATHLNRAPSGFADGLTVVLAYPHSASSFGYAGDAKSLFETTYKLRLSLLLALPIGPFDVYAFHYGGEFADDGSDVQSVIASDVAGIDTGGYNNLLSASVLTAAPVGWALYGVRQLGDSNLKVGMHGMGWVDTDGITGTSAAGYTLSTQNVFDASVDASSGVGLSRVLFSFPYPITVLANGISPFPTSNPLPHVTGKMQWDSRHPIGRFDLTSGPTDYSVNFDVGADYGFPNVQNEMLINQSKLNQDGILEVLFNLENIGDVTAEEVN
ncbi:MAG: hypothetical protein ACW98K_17450, partial [Candidatus Kariarchaeaceae archaeon]